jgi:hypothetical protein
MAERQKRDKIFPGSDQWTGNCKASKPVKQQRRSTASPRVTQASSKQAHKYKLTHCHHTEQFRLLHLRDPHGITKLQEVHNTTRISIQALHRNSLSQFSVDERMSWATPITSIDGRCSIRSTKSYLCQYLGSRSLTSVEWRTENDLELNSSAGQRMKSQLAIE